MVVGSSSSGGVADGIVFLLFLTISVCIVIPS
jgi:hypothetical protein